MEPHTFVKCLRSHLKVNFFGRFEDRNQVPDMHSMKTLKKDIILPERALNDLKTAKKKD